MATTPSDSRDRLDIRLPKNSKEKLKKASALAGARTLSEYILRVAEEDADRVLGEHSLMTLEADLFDRFIAACEQAEPPNQALRKAVELARERGIE